jgi:sugar lactone lactonase YvrE
MKINRLDAIHAGVGESPLWDANEHVLYFVDVVGKTVNRFDPASGALKTWPVPGFVGALALREGGGAVLALQDGFYGFDVATGDVALLARPDTLGPQHQLNDGKVDRAGRFVVGTMDQALKEHNGYLYSFGTDHGIRTLDTGICISNGPCWSLDDRTFYFSDSPRNLVWAYDYDIATGTVSNRRDWVKTESLGGFPDGATVDSAGRVWVAICGGGKVAAFRPDGTLDQVVELPVAAVASVAFGGPDLDRLYVTTIDPSLLGFPAGEEGSGSIFVVEGLDARGVPEPRYRG